MTIRTRFSPSPTGLLHLGNVRAALFSALYALHTEGIFLLRIEDTDAVRSEERFIERLQSDLHWLGVHWQEGPGVGGPKGPYQQSERNEIYQQYYQQLIDEKKAYPCFCTDQELALNRKIQLSRGQAPRYPGTCKKLTEEEVSARIAKGLKPALRFKVPENTVIEFNDLVKGPQKFLSDDIGDFIVRRADGSSSFMFCNAIDDSLMGTTHVIRGEDHLTNTPRQRMILSALALRSPEYGHLSLILGEDGTPLSKRHGSFSLHDLREQGFLPQAILNYLARLSHTYEENRLMTYAELGAHFHLSRLSRASARFDLNQLLHWQKEAVMQLNSQQIKEWLGEDIRRQVPDGVWESFAEVVRQNNVFPDCAKKWAGIFFNDLTWGEEANGVLQQAGSAFFLTALEAVKHHGTDMKSLLNEIKNALNVSGKNLFMPIRVALTGEQQGPDLQSIANVLGKEKMMERFQQSARKVGHLLY